MCQCWFENAANRPTFQQIRIYIENVMTCETDYIDVVDVTQNSSISVANNTNVCHGSPRHASLLASVCHCSPRHAPLITNVCHISSHQASLTLQG